MVGADCSTGPRLGSTTAARVATPLEDLLLREKITCFDHEPIPERLVHARGSAARGHFEA